MNAPTSSFADALAAKVAEQLKAQRVGYLLGAGSSYLHNTGYPLASELWELIKDRIDDPQQRADIHSKLDGGATGLEQALDLLDDGGALDTPYRHLVTAAIETLFIEMCVSNRHLMPRAILSGHATTGKPRGAGATATARD